MDSRIAGLKDLMESKTDAAEKAAILAASAINVRLAAMNEFRQALEDQAANMISRNESDLQHRAIESDLRSLRESRAQSEGKASQSSVMIAQGISVFSLILSILIAITDLLKK